MKLCVDCKWFEKWMCHSPRHKEEDPVSGGMVYREVWMQRPKFVRDQDFFTARMFNLCGKSGRFWEPKR